MYSCTPLSRKPVLLSGRPDVQRSGARAADGRDVKRGWGRMESGESGERGRVGGRGEEWAGEDDGRDGGTDGEGEGDGGWQEDGGGKEGSPGQLDELFEYTYEYHEGEDKSRNLYIQLSFRLECSLIQRGASVCMGRRRCACLVLRPGRVMRSSSAYPSQTPRSSPPAFVLASRSLPSPACVCERGWVGVVGAVGGSEPVSEWNSEQGE